MSALPGTTGGIRFCYSVYPSQGGCIEAREAEFDRWLAGIEEAAVARGRKSQFDELCRSVYEGDTTEYELYMRGKELAEAAGTLHA